jgi:hypothetical protein
MKSPCTPLPSQILSKLVSQIVSKEIIEANKDGPWEPLGRYTDSHIATVYIG